MRYTGGLPDGLLNLPEQEKLKLTLFGAFSPRATSSEKINSNESTATARSRQSFAQSGCKWG